MVPSKVRLATPSAGRQALVTWPTTAHGESDGDDLMAELLLEASLWMLRNCGRFLGWQLAGCARDYPGKE